MEVLLLWFSLGDGEGGKNIFKKKEKEKKGAD